MSIRVMQPGPLLTFQDSGRSGFRHWGVPGSGALDPVAYTIANRLAGNVPNGPCLEVTGVGCRLHILEACILAITGGDLGVYINDQPFPLWHACYVRPGAELSWTQRRSGARCYLAAAGGLVVEQSLGSSSTLINGPFPGRLSRPLQPGDVVELGQADPKTERAGVSWPLARRPHYPAASVIRLLPGPHLDLFLNAREQITSAPWSITPASNRMGYRLAGLPLSSHYEPSLASFGVIPGVIQVPPDGQPLVLLADAQTTGGYPVVATVIAADLSKLGQLLPGDQISFTWTTLNEANHSYQELARLVTSSLDDTQEWGVPC